MGITEKEFLECKDILETFIPKIGKEKWQTVYWKDTGIYCRQGSKFAVWCALLTPEAAEKSLNSDDLSFDLDFCSSGPDIGTLYSQNAEPENYYVPSHNKPIKPFVLVGYDEGLCEEFRLLHQCKLNEEHNSLLIKDESGNPVEIAKLEKDRVEVHLKYLKDFLAISQLHLVIYIDVIRYSKNGMPYQIDTGMTNGFRWEREIAESPYKMEGDKWCSVFRGKALIAPTSRDEAVEKKYEPDSRCDEVKFIIGTDENGENILSGCNSRIVGEHLYLRPVQFKKQVLDKYYDEPEKYSVEEGCVRCNPYWLVRIDNDHTNKVAVFLGDLYQLPYEEMLYWKSFNVPVDGYMSRSNFRNSFECIPTDAEVSDHRFRKNYLAINDYWKEKYHFSLFKKPAEPDKNLLATLQIPGVNSQKAFDEQVLILTKLLVDLINVEELDKRYGPFEKDAKSIQKLESSFTDLDSFTSQLRKLQQLRSTGAAHTKGKRYQLALKALNITCDDRPRDFSKILETINDCLEDLLRC